MISTGSQPQSSSLLAIFTTFITLLALGDEPKQYTKNEMLTLFKQHPVQHPSIILTKDSVDRIRAHAAQDPLYQASVDHLIGQADAIAQAAPLQRTMKGRRMLFTSRRCLKRVVYSAFAYHLSGKDKYLNAARRDMLAAAAFKDWNPKHFLDVGEMTTALGLGYDWLYSSLNDDECKTIRNAIIAKGLGAVRKNMWWLDAENNWNQVCNGGLAIGALAIRDKEPEIAAEALAHTLRRIPKAMEVYEPDGAFPEGPGYWKYGTAYNVLLIDALRTSLKTEAGLLDRFPGFLKSGPYERHSLGPSHILFCYSDCTREVEREPDPILFWFARELRQPKLIDFSCEVLPRFFESGHRPASRKNRFFPFLLLWAPKPAQATTNPLALSWHGQGRTPVAFHRSSWNDSEAVYVAIKGGSPKTNHAHLDIGSFVLDAKGLRWAEDLGKESYTTMEKHKLGIWDRSQNSDRWKVYRHSNMSHNTLVINKQHQRVNSHSPIVRSQLTGHPRFTIVDIAPAYGKQVTRAQRGVRLDADATVSIQDELTLKGDATVRWGMITRAKVTRLNAGLVRLSLEDKQIYLQLHGPESAEWTEYSTRRNYDFNRSNEGTTMLGFSVDAKKGASLQWRVTAHLQRPEDVNATRPLQEW